MKLLALVVAYAINHFVDKPEKYRNFDWFKKWSDMFLQKVFFSIPEINILLIVAIPSIVVSSFIGLLFYPESTGLLISSVFILAYCIGPDSLDKDVDSGEIRKKLSIKKNANIEVLIKKMAQISLKRWFAVFFWYVILGVFGAILYRLTERLDNSLKKNNEFKTSISKLLRILSYPVAWIMVVSLAIASDFDKIYKKCKPAMTIEKMKSLDISFLYEATDFAVEICEVEPESTKTIEQVTLSVLNRMLVVWLVFVSVLVIFRNF